MKLFKVCFSILLITLVIGNAKANLMTDADGFSIELTTPEQPGNLFGPPEFSENYNPFTGFINMPPVQPLPDETEMEVSFFSNYIEIRQFVATPMLTDPVNDPWSMLFSNIDTTLPILGVSIDGLSNTFAHPLTISSTASSISIDFLGATSDILQFQDDEWFARLDIEFGPVQVSSPSVWFVSILAPLLLMCRGRIKSKANVNHCA